MRKFDGNTLVVATHNAGKLDEIRRLLTPFSVTVLSAGDLGLESPEETGATFVENARIKAHFAATATGHPALADDSGIEVEALRGAPGVHTADWAETPEGRDFALAMTKTWERLEEIDAPFPRRARFCSTLVLAWPDGEDEVFTGTIDGQIVWPMRGELGHGYDPIFRPDGYDKTFGEMNPEEKNRISHRADAFRKLVKGCFQ